MAHDRDPHGHEHHDHDHAHSHEHGGHHHHCHGDHHHDWHSQDYVRDWIARDTDRLGERQPIIDRLIAAVPFPRDAAIAVLDVGGGSGVLTEAVFEAFPKARVTLQDYSAPMVERARERFAQRGDQVRYVISDLRDAAWPRSISGPFDLAVSAIAIHNLYDMAMIAACYQAMHGVLKPGGWFLDYDHFDRAGGLPLHQHTLKVAGFKSVETVWHEYPTAILKAQA